MWACSRQPARRPSRSSPAIHSDTSAPHRGASSSAPNARHVRRGRLQAAHFPGGPEPDAAALRQPDRSVAVENAYSSPSLSTSAESNVGWTNLIYGLHAFSLITGIIGAATVVGAFLTGWPSLIAVILNYVKRSDVRGTW